MTNQTSTHETRTATLDRWHGFQLHKLTLTDVDNNPVPVVLLLPNDQDEIPHPCVIAVHGFTAKKENWLELGGYTKGGNVVQGLLESGYAVLALDMYYHGENRDDKLTVSYDVLIKEYWELFFERTLHGIHSAIAYIDANETLNPERIGYLSYSMGGVFGFRTANATGRIKAMVACVPPVFREDDDKYAPYNNVDNLSDIPFLMISATQDEHIDFSDAQWLFSKLPEGSKKFIAFDSDHSLPLDYVDIALSWFKEYL